MNILVTGANGQLGNEMQVVSRECDDFFFFTDICEGYFKLDITNFDEVRNFVKKNDIHCIINCAAWTNVDGAEVSESYSVVEKLNSTAPDNLAKIMKEKQGLLVHVSTDYVFGKEAYNTPCSEENKGTPTGIYGYTKLKGEEKIIASAEDYVIIRTSWLYSEFGKNFVKNMLDLTALNPEVKVVIDQVGTPTYALDLAKVIMIIINDYKSSFKRPYSKTGIYNYSNEGVCTWYDFAQMIAKLRGQNNCNIIPCRSEEFSSPVKRPSYSVLDKSKIKRTFNVKVPYWVDSLQECLANLN